MQDLKVNFYLHPSLLIQHVQNREFRETNGVSVWTDTDCSFMCILRAGSRQVGSQLGYSA